jgi:hypothetical protein
MRVSTIGSQKAGSFWNVTKDVHEISCNEAGWRV